MTAAPSPGGPLALPRRAAAATAALLNDAARHYFAHNGPVYAANMAFLGMLALFPFVLFLVSLSGLFGQTETGALLVEMLLETVPERVADTLSGPIERIIGGARTDLLTGGVLVALWTASAGVHAARVTVLRAFEAPTGTRREIRRRIETLGLVILLSITATGGIALYVLTPAAIALVESYAAIPKPVFRLAALTQYLFSPALLFAVHWVFYRICLPGWAKRDRAVAPGALFAALAWLAIGWGLSLYLRNLGQYDATYGSLSGAVVTQLFFLLGSSGFIFGAEINAAVTRRRRASRAGRTGTRDATSRGIQNDDVFDDDGGQARPDHGAGQ
ncbi:hypothetical protein CCR85_12415 [Rhodothalassium salexigens]|uniref:YihY/virulence factor BrkB family protein n=1 Tax=Rhodothalassium salexigens TaxID=1086 RepID=UPI001914877C|nr:YihY/virulence factor BrkB family protein [Rhodothalassium salexigens]MBK5912294.1 hypothetical protein [Rhodothalassium salexigens]MBK5920285.1 hypothetical protein [Rhodothalassium salexigens]